MGGFLPRMSARAATSTHRKTLTLKEMRVFKHSFTRTHAYSNTQGGWQAQRYPSQAAISMEMVLIVPTDHTCSARQAR